MDRPSPFIKNILPSRYDCVAFSRPPFLTPFPYVIARFAESFLRIELTTAEPES